MKHVFLVYHPTFVRSVDLGLIQSHMIDCAKKHNQLVEIYTLPHFDKDAQPFYCEVVDVGSILGEKQ